MPALPVDPGLERSVSIIECCTTLPGQYRRAETSWWQRAPWHLWVLSCNDEGALLALNFVLDAALTIAKVADGQRAIHRRLLHTRRS